MHDEHRERAVALGGGMRGSASKWLTATAGSSAQPYGAPLKLYINHVRTFARTLR
jgi:hypothetical protein